jgi:hypothetical protein
MFCLALYGKAEILHTPAFSHPSCIEGIKGVYVLGKLSLSKFFL